MAGNYLSNPNPQWLDDNGDPLSGGKVNFWEAGGTSSRQDTFTDKDLTGGNENANPIILDSDGRSPTAIFLQQLSYNIVVTNSANTTQTNASRDNVSNILQVSLSGVATIETYAAARATAGATMSNGNEFFIKTRTARGDGAAGHWHWNSTSTETDDDGTVLKLTDTATGRLHRDYLKPWVHVAWFGSQGGTKATAPGSITDDLAFLQKATDNHLKVLFDGDKRYRADGTLTIRGGAAWCGAGGNFAELVTTNTTLPLVKAENAGTARTQKIEVTGMHFFATTSFTGTRLIDFRGVSQYYWNCLVFADVTTVNGPLASTTMFDNTVGFGDPFGDAVNAFNIHAHIGPRANIRGGKWNINLQGNEAYLEHPISSRATEYGFRSDLLQNAVFVSPDFSNNGLAGARLINTVDDFVRGVHVIAPFHESNEDRTAGQFSPSDWDIDTEILGEVYVSRGRNQQPVNIKSFWHGARGIQNVDTGEVMTGSGRVATQNILENADFSQVDAAATPANLPYGWAYSNGGGSNSAFTALSSGLPPGVTSGIQITHSGSGAHSLEQTVTTIESESHSIFGWVWADGNVTDVRFGIKPASGTNQLFSFETPDTDSTWYPVKIFYEAESGVTSIELGITSFSGPSGAIIKLAGFNGTRSAQNFADRHKPITDAGGNVYGNLAITDGKLAIPTSTTALLEAIAADVNTNAAKRQGSMVFNITTQAPVWSEGAADGSIWNDATGSTKHTPV